MHRGVLRAQENVLGKEHPDTLTSVRSLALVLQRQDQFDEAMLLYQRALSGREKALGKEHPDTLSSLSDLAYLFHQRCQYPSALPLYQKARAGFEATLGSEHPRTQRCTRHYSGMLDKMRRNSNTEIEPSVISTDL